MSEILEKRIGAQVNPKPVVSVVIPAYDAAEFIAETLTSVFDQTYEDYEVVLVNDGSPDTPTLEKELENYFEKIVYIKQENAGTAAARNTAIRNSRGEFLAFLDGDDIWFDEYLKSQLDQLKAKNCDLIYCDALLFGSVTDPRETYMIKSPSRGAVTTESLLDGACNVITSGTVARREKIVAAGMFDEDLPRIGMEDFDLWFRLAKGGAKLDYQKKVLLKYRVRANSLSGSNVRRAERSVKALETIRRKYELSETEKTIVEKRSGNLAARLEVEKGKFYLAQKDYESAKKNLFAAGRQTGDLKLKILNRLLQINPRIVRWLFMKARRAEFAFIMPIEKSKSR